MQNYDFLKKSYFYDDKMMKDEIVSIAGDCMQQLAAIVLKNTINYPVEYYTIYLEDITFQIALDEEGNLARSGIKCNTSGIDKEIYDTEIVIIENDSEKAMQVIHETLEKHKYAILRTADALLPFSIYYQPDNFITSKFNPEGHVFMIIGEDDENYYYVEQLSEVNEKGYRHVPGRNDIGVYEKEKFREALSIFAGVAVFQFRRQNILRSHEFSMEILRKMGYHYYNNIDTSMVKWDNVKISGGKCALMVLEKILGDRNLSMDRKVYNFTKEEYSHFDVGKELFNGITGIVNRRMVLAGYLEKENFHPQILYDDIYMWNTLKAILIRRYYRQKYLLGSTEELECMKQIIVLEEKIFEFLKQYTT